MMLCVTFRNCSIEDLSFSRRIFALKTLSCIFYVVEAILLSFQNYIVILGTTVLIMASLVPQKGGRNVRLYENNWKKNEQVLLDLIILFSLKMSSL